MKRDSIGLYIHIPFCRSKCAYCDFLSVAGADWLIDEYIQTLTGEVEQRAKESEGREVVSIFFGGGTPSLLTAKNVDKILTACHRHLNVSPGAEITIEANPESLTLRKARGYLKTGINRLSIGIQSLDNRYLESLGRIHNARQAAEAVGNALAAGFKNVSADLMFALPGQSVDEWADDLERATGLGIGHISCYQLTPEPGTPFGHDFSAGRVSLPENNDEFFRRTSKILRKHGFSHYEISNYAKRGLECLHNLGYWEYRDWLGLGAGAHSSINGIRLENVRQIEGYISGIKEKGAALAETERLTEKAAQTERLMLGLRLKKGAPLKNIRITPGIKKMIASGFLTKTKTRLKATAKGWPLLDSVLAEL